MDNGRGVKGRQCSGGIVNDDIAFRPGSLRRFVYAVQRAVVLVGPGGLLGWGEGVLVVGLVWESPGPGLGRPPSRWNDKNSNNNINSKLSATFFHPPIRMLQILPCPPTGLSTDH